MSDVINTAGWIGWNPPEDLRTAFSSFQEFNNTGPGALGPRNFTLPQYEALVYSDILQQVWQRVFIDATAAAYPLSCDFY